MRHPRYVAAVCPTHFPQTNLSAKHQNVVPREDGAPSEGPKDDAVPNEDAEDPNADVVPSVVVVQNVDAVARDPKGVLPQRTCSNSLPMLSVSNCPAGTTLQRHSDASRSCSGYPPKTLCSRPQGLHTWIGSLMATSYQPSAVNTPA